jgi:hypothetical protein
MRFLLVPALLLAGCIPYGEGAGDVRGAIEVPRCAIASTGIYESRSFPDFIFSPSWFWTELRGQVLEIRLQRDAQSLHRTDVLVLQVRDIRTVVQGTEMEVRPDLEPEGGLAASVRLGLTLNATCPRFGTSLLGRGTITFREFVPSDEGVVNASFNVDLVDGQAPRTQGSLVVLGHLTGTFRIPVHLVPEPG